MRILHSKSVYICIATSLIYSVTERIIIELRSLK